MASQLQLSRETALYLHQDGVYWRLPVLNGFSFSQTTSTTEVVINEMEDVTGISRRGRSMFTDAFNPAEWSFQMYARPASVSGVGGFAVDEALWANFVAINQYTHAGTSWSKATTRSTSDNSVTFDFSESNRTLLGSFDLYFVLGGCASTDLSYAAADGQTIYKISDCVANSATMSFDIDGIATTEWGGFGALIEEQATLDLTAATVITTGTQDTDNFIRNRLTTLSITTLSQNQDANAGNEFAQEYQMALTGGSITFENGITFLTPEEICRVNQPVGHVTGTRSISGNFTCYLDAGTNSSGNSTSADLFDDLATAVNVSTNRFNLVFDVGGASQTPKLVFDIPQAHLEIPTHQIDDIISLETNFHALPSDISETDECTIKYVGA
jgi:hypothetical protein